MASRFDQPRDPGARGDRSRRPFSRPDGPSRAPARRAGVDRFERKDRSYRPDRPDRSDRPERGPRAEGSDRPDRFERGPRFERPEGSPRFSRFGSRPEGRPDTRPERRPEGRTEGRYGSNRYEGRPERRQENRFEPRSQGVRPQRRFDGRPDRSSRPDGGPRFSRPERNPDELTPSAEAQGTPEVDDLIWGRHSALAVLDSGRPIHRIWCTPEMRFSSRFLQLLREAKGSGVLVEEVTWARLAQLSGGAVHQGIVLQTAAAETLDISTLVEGCKQLGEAPILMAVDGITDPHNLGAIVRSAEALGAHGLVLPQRRNAGLTGSVAKVAAGALEHLPVAKVVNLNRALESLKEEGYRVVGLAEEGNVSLLEADLEGPLVVVTGSEGSGLSMLTRRHCDQLIRIPLRGVTPSLNASVATAMLLYEVARRGWMATIKGQEPAPRIQRVKLGNAPNAGPTAEMSSEQEVEADGELETDDFGPDIRL